MSQPPDLQSPSHSTLPTPSPPQTHPLLPPPFRHLTPQPALLAHGAEALLFKTHFLTPSIPCALKIRPLKKWRHPTLDARLTKQRVLAEARVLVKLRREGVDVPGVLGVEWEGERWNRKDRGDGSVGGKKEREGESKREGKEERVGGWMIVEWIEGGSVRGLLESWVRRWEGRKGGKEGGGEEGKGQREWVDLMDLMRSIGRAVGRMHVAGVVHGDLTTSNLMLRPKKTKGEEVEKAVNGDVAAGNIVEGGEDGVGGEGGSVGGEKATSAIPVATDANTTKDYELNSLQGDLVLIDFGLASQSLQDEDRAVDLYVLERAFGSTHPTIEEVFSEVLEGYRGSFKGAGAVLKRLVDVRARGRKKSMIG